MRIVAPQDFVTTTEFANRKDAPVAFVLPTTAAARAGADVEKLATVGDLRLGAQYSPSDVLHNLRMQPTRPALVVFTDQIVDQANTSILVKTDHSDLYVSPLELILSANYGYTLLFWTPTGFVACPAGTLELTAVARGVVDLLEGAGALGAQWELSGLQELRRPETRRISARRKLRFYRSSVINAFKHAPDSQEAKRLIDRADALDETIDAWSTAA